MNPDSIFTCAVKKLKGNVYPLLYGPAKPVWLDRDFSRDTLEKCMQEMRDNPPRHSEGAGDAFQVFHAVFDSMRQLCLHLYGGRPYIYGQVGR